MTSYSPHELRELKNHSGVPGLNQSVHAGRLLFGGSGFAVATTLPVHFHHGGEQRLTEKPVAPVTQRAPSTRSNIPMNTVLIGQKPMMAYATAIVMQINSGSKELSVKARGRVISKAVDVVEVCRRRFFDGNLEIKGVNIGTEVLGEEGQTRNVSTIEIKLAKK
jgi:DNA-binding protein